MPSFKIKDNAAKMGFLLSLILLANVCLSQEFPVVEAPGNKNLKLTVKVITIKSKHFIIPNLKVLMDTQDIQVHKEITYASERIPIANCNFYLMKIIKNKLVNIYVNQFFHPDVDTELRKFTTKDSLTDTACIENFIPLEPGPYRVYLGFRYYRNGVEDIIYSDETDFFVKPPKPAAPSHSKRSKKKILLSVDGK